MNITSQRGIKLFTAGALLLASIGANAALIKSYDFDAGLGDTLGNGLDLVASGGTVGSGRYSFAANQGLRLDSALLDTASYGIEMRFQMNDSTGGYNKLIDFQDLASDFGLYVLNGAVDFFTAGPGAGSITLNTDYTVGIERAAGSISVFLDGALLFSVADGGQALSGPNILNFVEDDNATGQNEAFAGSLDFIRIHEDRSSFGQAPPPVLTSEPGVLALALLGALGVASRRRKQA